MDESSSSTAIRVVVVVESNRVVGFGSSNSGEVGGDEASDEVDLERDGSEADDEDADRDDMRRFPMCVGLTFEFAQELPT